MNRNPKIAVWSDRHTVQRWPLHIVVVDDYAIGAEAVALGLDSAGYTTRYATNGEGALLHLNDWRLDIAVLDINMPAPDGYRLALTLRSIVSSRDALIIAHTSMDEPAVRPGGLAAGFDAFCQKGDGVRQLIDLIIMLSAKP